MSKVLPLISIGIPTYNRAHMLRKCLNSVLQQSYGNIEVIVSDNLSSDTTPDVCQEFMLQDNRLRTYRQTTNIKAVPNFDYVRQKAKGAYFMLLGDDDWIDPNLIESCVDFLEENPDYIAASGETYYYRENNIQFKGVSLSVQSNDPAERLLNTISEVVDAGTLHGMFRAETANATPYLNVWGMDYHFLCEVAFRGKIKTLADVACHRIDNSHRTSIKDVLYSEGICDGQELDPYGTIASVLFWRILADGDIFKQLLDYERLRLAIAVVQIIEQRWLITRKVNLLDIAAKLFTNQNLLAEYRILRIRVMSEWLNAFEMNESTQWNFVRQILDTFIQLGISVPDANQDERDLLTRIIDASLNIKDLDLKSDANRIGSLFA